MASCATRAAAGATLLLLLLAPLAVTAQSPPIDPQGWALDKFASFFKGPGNNLQWGPTDTSKDPCNTNNYAKVDDAFKGVSCQGSQVSSIILAGQTLNGSVPNDPYLWQNLPGLTTLNLAGTGVSGPVPGVAMSGAKALVNVDLSGNPFLCGPAPSFNSATINTAGTAVGTPCPTGPSSPAPSPTPDATASPAPTISSNAANTATGSGTPEPAPVIIANLPICTCANNGFGSTQCQGAFNTRCMSQQLPACAAFANAGADAGAANQVSQFLQGECFNNQTMAVDACPCTANLNSNECAKGRVALCLNKDAACLAFQTLSSANASAADQKAVADYVAKSCPAPQATKQGVSAQVLFKQLAVADFYNQGYTQKIANALASVAGVPSSSISVMDVRPVTIGGQRRVLLQAAGPNMGLQATYFIATDDPKKVADAINNAALNGGLNRELQNQGVSNTASSVGLGISNPNSGGGGTGGGSSGDSFPMWAIGVIVAGAAFLLVLLLLLLWLCKRKAKKNKAAAVKATEYAPSKSGPYDERQHLPVTNQQVSKGAAPALAATGVAAAAGVTAAAVAGSRSSSQQPPVDDYRPPSYYNDAAASNGYEAAAGNGLPRSARQNSSSLTSAQPAPETATLQTATSARALASQGSASSFGAGVTPPAPVRTSLNAAPASKAQAQPARPASMNVEGGRQPSGGGWQTNVRPTSSTSLDAGAVAAAAAGAGAGAAGVAAMTSGSNPQQAERAKFWAQFQDLMTQVNTTKARADDEPETPSSGTNWTETEVASPHKRAGHH